MTLKYKTPDNVHQAFYRQKSVDLYQDWLQKTPEIGVIQGGHHDA